jgi:glycosyltransferase involved in cell wall biosynthesis
MIMHRLHAHGGHERSTMEILVRLARSGWDIHVVSFDLEEWPESLPVTHHKMPHFHPKIQIIENMLFVFYVAIWRMFNSGMKGLFVTLGVSASEADLRVIQFVNYAYRNSIAEGRAKYPVTRTFFHLLYQKLYTKLESIREKQVLPKTKRLIAISGQVAEELHSGLGTKIPPISIVHHGSDVVEKGKIENKGNAKKNLGLDPDVPLIIFVGAMERKGIDKALRILALSNETSWNFVVLGRGQIEKWQSVAINAGLGERIKFVGFQKVEPYWSAADILLFPSTYEPFGLVVSEAASYGVLPLASNECGAMELWSDRPAGLNLSAKDSDEVWAAALNTLLTDHDKFENLNEQAKETFLKWDWDAVYVEYEKIVTKMYDEKY